MNHLKSPPFTTLHPSEDEKPCEQKREEGPPPSLAVEENHVVRGVGEPRVAEAEEVVDEGEGEEGAALVLLGVVDDGDVGGVAEDFGEVAAALAVAEIDGEEGGFREVLVEVGEDLAEVEGVHSVGQCFGGEAGIEDVDSVGEFE